MKVTLQLPDESKRPAKPFDAHALVEGECPLCKATPFSVAGTGMRTAGHDAYESDAVCLACRKRVGTIRAEVSTIFGTAEDERVLGGPWKVY